MAGTLSDEARKLLLQINMNHEAEQIDSTTDPARELLRFGYITLKDEPLNPSAAKRALRWVRVTEPGNELLKRYYSIPPEHR